MGGWGGWRIGCGGFSFLETSKANNPVQQRLRLKNLDLWEATSALLLEWGVLFLSLPFSSQKEPEPLHPGLLLTDEIAFDRRVGGWDVGL